MTRLLVPGAVLALALVLTGCTPSDPVATPDPVASEPAADRPTPTPTATATEAPPAALDPLSVPCDDLLPRADVERFLSASAVSQGDTSGNPGGGGRASTDPNILALMPAGSRHCTWVVPDSDGGLIVSVMVADAATRAAVEALTTLSVREDGADATYLTFTALDQFTFTETHALGTSRDLWVAAFTTGDSAREIAGIVWARLTR